MNCPACNAATIKYGRTAAGNQRHLCKSCGRTVTDSPAPSPIAPMRIPFDRAVLCLNLLVEGGSMRATERITGTHRDTVCRLLVLAGGKCEALLGTLIQDVEVANVEADELWAFVAKKEKTKAKLRETDPETGDAYSFLALDSDTKLILAHHTGRRTAPHTDLFVEKLERATAGRFQLTTDGFSAYPEAVSFHLGTRTDYATLVKEYGTETQEERRYSPPRIIAATKTPIHGAPVEDRICTSYVVARRARLELRRHQVLRPGEPRTILRQGGVVRGAEAESGGTDDDFRAVASRLVAGGHRLDVGCDGGRRSLPRAAPA